ncbi:MAG: carbohydrate ABC transporter permease [Candidatus Humimicrobiaceae bacterium]
MRKVSLKSKLINSGPVLAFLPALLIVVLILIPFGYSIYYSFTNISLTSKTINFVGINNFKDYFTNGIFWHNTKVTFSYTFLSIFFEFLLGFLIANLLNQDTVLGKILQPFLLFPLMISPIIGTLMWKLMMNPEFSVLNFILKPFGIPEGFKWSANSSSALYSAVLVDVWMFTPFVAIIILAGLKGMPKKVFEAAQVDGLSRWQTFKKITLPLLLPYIIIALIFRFIDSIAQFDIIFGLTKGGPGDTLMNYQVQAYTISFSYFKIGYGSAIMLIMWIIVYIVSNYLVKYWHKLRSNLS